MSEAKFSAIVVDENPVIGSRIEEMLIAAGNFNVQRFVKHNDAYNYLWGDIVHDGTSRAVPHEESLIMLSEFTFSNPNETGFDLADYLRKKQKNSFIWLYSNAFEGTLSEGSVLYNVNAMARANKINGYCRNTPEELQKMIEEAKRQTRLYSLRKSTRSATRQLPPVKKD